MGSRVQALSKDLKALLYYTKFEKYFVLDSSKKLFSFETGVIPAVMIDIFCSLVA